MDDGPDIGSGLDTGESARSQPIRTCIGCRAHDAQSNLIRVVATASDGTTRVEFDRARRTPGRGAWLHERCLMRAISKRAFGRAFRVVGNVDTSALTRGAHQHGTNQSHNVDLESGLEADGHPMSTQR
ncbi:hypothetical protein GCM10010401_01890 [Rarobacter faecitabidus]|uniref:YlxR domain-containing protein n=2 Tax=Rarobacter faecitabidus TaxID=13243 RepID=A0A542ZWQ2_RARFA|nr:YlxR family protein [Rarobacter faecitabidus]TQL64676.1 hypothetical protein FB461_1185 [Rarobacter faecitabidus]